MPGALPIVGHGLAFHRDPLAVLAAARRYGGTPIVRVPDPVVVLCEPEDVQHVLVTRGHAYAKTPRLWSERARNAFGRGTLTARGDEHRRLRRLVQPGFAPGAVARVLDGAVAGAVEATEGWRPGVHDVYGDLASGARMGIQRALFGTLPDAALVDRAIAERRAFAVRWFAAVHPRPELLPSPANLRYRRSEAWLRTRVSDVVHDRLRTPGDDVVSILAHRQNRVGDRLSPAEVIEEALLLTVPGHETIGEGLAWTLDLLARHPGAQAAARTAAMEGDTSMLDRVLEESLRLYPPTWIVVRMATEDDELPSGRRLAPGARVYVSPWVVHRDPRWWPDPLAFRPERFRPDASRAPQRAYFPFGAGPHVCVGERYARAEMAGVVATLLRRWQFRAVGPPPRPRAALTLSPRSVPLRLERL